MASADPMMGAGQAPPHDLDAEAAVLSSIIARPERLAEVQALLAPEDFYNPANGLIYEALVGLNQSGQPVDIVTVGTWLRDCGRLVQIGGPAYLASVVDGAPSVYHIEAYAKTVARKAARRRIVAEARAIVAEGCGTDLNEDDWIASIDGRLSAAARADELHSLETLGEVVKRGFQEVYKQWQEPTKALTCGAKFGHRGLDNHFGFLRTGGVTILAGYPGDGKSALALQAALATAEQRNGERLTSGSLIFSVEMPSVDLGLRGLFQHARVNSANSRPHRLSRIRDEQWHALIDSVNALGQLPVWFDDSSETNPDRIQAVIRRTKAKAEKLGVTLQLVVVDYVQLVGAGNRLKRKNANREEEVSTVGKSLKVIAKSEKVHILALAQLNDDANSKSKDENKRPSKSNLRESKALGQHSDNIVLIYNPEARKRAARKIAVNEDPSEDPDVCDLIIDKFRGGSVGSVEALFWPHLTMFGSPS